MDCSLQLSLCARHMSYRLPAGGAGGRRRPGGYNRSGWFGGVRRSNGQPSARSSATLDGPHSNSITARARLAGVLLAPAATPPRSRRNRLVYVISRCARAAVALLPVGRHPGPTPGHAARLSRDVGTEAVRRL